MSSALGLSALAIGIFMILAFTLAQLLRDNSIVDIFWGLGFMWVTAVFWLSQHTVTILKIIFSSLILIWGLRLSLYVYGRKRGKPEDFRYAQWRRDWGRWFVVRSFFQIFLLQGAIMWAMLLPLYAVWTHPVFELSAVIIGGIVFITGFIFETLGDAQMARFKKDPVNKGKIITHGLWSVSRHPNYFGESLMWWGIGILAFPSHWLALLSPLLITLLLNFVSGVPMLERRYRDHPDWEAYASNTSRFFPWLGRKG